jgi:hypothetical protein
MQHTLEWAVPAMILAGFTEEERCNALVDASINVLSILPLEETDMKTCSRKEEMFGWKFWHYFPRNRMDVHEIQLEVQSCKPSRMHDLRMKCLWF